MTEIIREDRLTRLVRVKVSHTAGNCIAGISRRESTEEGCKLLCEFEEYFNLARAERSTSNYQEAMLKTIALILLDRKK